MGAKVATHKPFLYFVVIFFSIHAVRANKAITASPTKIQPIKGTELEIKKAMARPAPSNPTVVYPTKSPMSPFLYSPREGLNNSFARQQAA